MELQDKTLKLKFDNSYNGRLFAVQGDTGRTYNLQILSDLNNVLDVSGMKLRLYIGNDKEVSYADGEVTSPEEGKFKVQVYNSQLKYPGLQKAQFVLTDKDGQKVGSKVFDLYVEEGLEVGPTLGKNILVDFETIGEALKLIRNYDKTLEEAKGVDLKLKVDIQEGTETREALVECKKKALEIKDQLDTSKTDAGKTLQDLKTTKDELKNLKTDLSSENTKAGDNIRTLGEKTEAGNSTIAGLGQSVEIASSTEASLKNTDTKAQGTKTEIEKLLGESKNTEQALKEIIASGDLDQYITDPKLQEALKAYATKEDLKGIDVTEQLKDYAKTVDVTSALENKVDVKAGYGLSQNDYTNEDKAKIDAALSDLAFQTYKTSLRDVADFEFNRIGHICSLYIFYNSKNPKDITKIYNDTRQIMRIKLPIEIARGLPSNGNKPYLLNGVLSIDRWMGSYQPHNASKSSNNGFNFTPSLIIDRNCLEIDLNLSITDFLNTENAKFLIYGSFVVSKS